MNAYGTTEDFNINWSGCDSLKDLRLSSIKGKDILPSPEDAPSLSILSAYAISGGISGDLELNGYNSISSVFFEYVYDLKNISCIGNRSITSGRFLRHLQAPGCAALCITDASLSSVCLL